MPNVNLLRIRFLAALLILSLLCVIYPMDTNKDHPLVLRVMRLTKPSLLSSFPITSEPHFLKSDTLVQSTNGSENFSTGELLTLPQSFGNIFLGETFMSYLSVINESNVPVSEVSLKADLQTESHRQSVSNTNPVPSLAPGSSLDGIVNHEVKELGTHILVCIVSYKRGDGEVKSFRKFFKFPVLKPLDVKTKFYNIQCDEVYLETQIQNITQSLICMDKVNFEPSSMYTVTQLNSHPDQTSIFNQSYMKPSDTRQYLFRLKLKEEHSKEAFTPAASSIGKLDIVWKSNFGERGRLQTSQLQKTATTASDIKLQVDSAPSEQPINKPFEITCEITNYSDRAKHLQLLYDDNSRIMWQGLSGHKLNRLDPKNSVKVGMSLLPTTPGLQKISGLKIVDTESNRTYDFDDIHEVLVSL